MFRAVVGDIPLAVGIVVTNTAEMAQKLARSDRPRFFGEHGAVSLHFGIKVELPALDELQNRRGGERLGNRGEAEKRFRSSGSGILQVGFAKALGPSGFSIEDHGYGDSRSAGWKN